MLLGYWKEVDMFTLKSVNLKLIFSVALYAVSMLFVGEYTSEDLVSQSVQTKTGNAPIENYLIVEFKSVPTTEELRQISKLPSIFNFQRLSTLDSDYFLRTYELQFTRSRSPKEMKRLLMKLPFVKRIDLRKFVSLMALFPSKENRGLTSDPHIDYQWALKNRGFSAESEKGFTSIHLQQKIFSNEGYDIGWSEIAKIEKKMTRDVVVAMIDSGVDYTHEDLFNSIARNPSRCKKGLFPRKVSRGKDGIKNDCVGWDFTIENEKGSHKPFDNAGHGSHLSGIIAARRNNSIGISGVSDRIKILPVKITYPKESITGENEGATIVLLDRLVKALEYAILRKVDVINLSLGWPKSADIPAIREMIKLAHKANIVIVAAAGNDNHNAPIFPCSNRGVVCVGSYGIDGKVSAFSNFGSHVDILTPGEEILSTVPFDINITKFNRTKKGYGFLSGTSQSAPYVSAMIAILKGIFPKITPTEVYGRVLTSSWRRSSSHPLLMGKKNFLGGPLHLPTLVGETGSHPVVVPLIKELHYVSINTNKSIFHLGLPIKNYGTAVKNIKMIVSSESPGIVIKKSTFINNKLLEHGQEREFLVPIEVTDSLSHSTKKIKIVIVTTGQARKTYYKDIVLQSEITTDKRWAISPLHRSRADKSIKSDIRFIWSVKTVPSRYQKGSTPEFYRHQIINKDTLHLSVYRKSGSRFENLPIFKLDGVVALLELQRIDLNFDNNEDYILTVIRRKRNSKSSEEFDYWYEQIVLNSSLKPLFKEDSFWKLELEFLTLLKGQESWVPFESLELGKILIPMYFDKYYLAETDVNPSDVRLNENFGRRGLYYFTPYRAKDGRINVKMRSLDRPSNIKRIKKELKLKYNDKITLVDILPKNVDNFQNDQTKILFEVDGSHPRDFYILNLKPIRELTSLPVYEGSLGIDWSISMIRSNGTPSISKRKLRPGIDLSGGQYKKRSYATFFEVENTNIDFFASVDWLSEENLSFNHLTEYHSPNVDDPILSVMANYKSGEKKFSYFSSLDRIHVFRVSPRYYQN